MQPSPNFKKGGPTGLPAASLLLLAPDKRRLAEVWGVVGVFLMRTWTRFSANRFQNSVQNSPELVTLRCLRLSKAVALEKRSRVLTILICAAPKASGGRGAMISAWRRKGAKSAPAFRGLSGAFVMGVHAHPPHAPPPHGIRRPKKNKGLLAG